MAFGDLPLDAPCKPNKGLEGGACNRQSCQVEPANWYNHGSAAWYCDDCRHDIQFDSFNLRDWERNWQPECGHPMFETRDHMDARKALLIQTTPPIPENETWQQRRWRMRKGTPQP